MDDMANGIVTTFGIDGAIFIIYSVILFLLSFFVYGISFRSKYIHQELEEINKKFDQLLLLSKHLQIADKNAPHN